MARRQKSTKETCNTKENDGKDVESKGVDRQPYEEPKKPPVPCARVESTGEWYPISRILETISVVGSEERLQSLVQWKPSWSTQLNSSSALRDFHGRAKVLGYFVKDSVLRSRIKRKQEFTREEFMCMNLRVRIENPDGSCTYEDMPYPEVKRRFPAALFEYLEGMMPKPRIAAQDEPRRDGLLAIYNNVALPRWLYHIEETQKNPEEEVSTGDSAMQAAEKPCSLKSDSVNSVMCSKRKKSVLKQNNQGSTAVLSPKVANKAPERKSDLKETRRDNEQLKKLRSSQIHQ